MGPKTESRRQRSLVRQTFKSVAIAVWSAWFRLLAFGGSKQRADRLYSVVLAAPGQGNIGDQAMLESYLHNTPGDIVVVARSIADLPISPSEWPRARVVAIPRLLYGFGLGVAAAPIRLRSLLTRAREFAVVGADIMDGAHNDGASVRRFDSASLAARMGVPTRVLGFSWNERPAPAAMRALRATDSRVVLIARDPISADRLRGVSPAPVVDGADLAFSHPVPDQSSSTLEWMGRERAEGRRVVLVNLNSLVEKRVQQIRAISPVLERYLSERMSVVVVPHDPRNSPSDVDLAEQLVSELGSSRVHAAPIGLTPSQIATLARSATITVSARMHLTILSLVSGTPVVGVSYQGKVQGLFDLLGIGDLCVDPASNFDAGLAEAIDRALAHEGELRAAIREGLARVTSLSRVNFEGRGW